MSFSNTDAVTVNPLELNSDFDSMINNSPANIAAIAILAAIALLLVGAIVFLSISNAKKFAAVDYESEEDEPSDNDRENDHENESEGMSSISGNDESRDLLNGAGQAGSMEAPQVGSERNEVDYSVR